jgi:hypothetical protein
VYIALLWIYPEKGYNSARTAAPDFVLLGVENVTVELRRPLQHTDASSWSVKDHLITQDGSNERYCGDLPGQPGLAGMSFELELELALFAPCFKSRPR